MNPAVLAALVSISTILVQQFVTHFLTRRKQQAETTKAEAEALRTNAEASKIGAERDSTFGKSYGELLDRLENVIARQDTDRETLNTKIIHLSDEIESLRKELHHTKEYAGELEEVAMRFRDVPGDEPMSVFVDRWLDAINSEIVEKLGLKLAIYLDDVDGRFALGHRVIPVEQLSPDQSSTQEYRDNRRRALIKFAADYREERGLNPVVTSDDLWPWDPSLEPPIL